MKKIVFLFSLTFVIAISACRKNSINVSVPPKGPQKNDTISFLSELNRFYDITQLPAYMPADSKIYQTSSYDTTGGLNDNLGHVAITSDGSYVLFQAKGKGVITRIWFAHLTNHKLSFYSGDSNTPFLTIPAIQLFNHTLSPFLPPLSDRLSGGYFSYVPIPFSNGLKIVCDKDIGYYQVECRSYPDSYKLQNFHVNLTNKETTLLSQIASLYNEPLHNVQDFYHGAFKTIDVSPNLSSGTSYPININTGGRIVGLEIEQLNATVLDPQLDLKITWDNNANPAIYAPMQNFFGYSFTGSSMRSLLLGSAEASAYCYYPMPFSSNAKIELVYRTPPAQAPAAPISLHVKVYVTPKPLDPKVEGRFHAYWNRALNTPNGLNTEHVFLFSKGRGHYVGSILLGQGEKLIFNNPVGFWEGDDCTYIDSMKPSLHGTGSEDYFNGAFYGTGWNAKRSYPMSGCLDYNEAQRYTGGYRLYLNDKLSYNHYLLENIEHGFTKANEYQVDYTSMGFYYFDGVSPAIPTPTNP